MPSKFFQFKKNLFLAILLLVIFVLPSKVLAENLLTVGSASSSLSGTDSAIFANIDSASPTSTFLLMLRSGSIPKFSVDQFGNVNTPGTIAAGSFTGPLTGTISAANVSSGTFGANTSLGNFSFPASVGIGTNNPLSILDVVSTGKFTVNSQAGSIKITPTSSISANEYGSALILNVRRSSDYDGAAIASVADSIGDWDAAGLAFLYHNVIGASDRIEAMRITSTGNVGIGTTAPNEQLEITKNFRLPTTSRTTPYGIIYKNGSPFIHDFNYGNNGTVTTAGENTFVGLYAGNFTMGSTATQTYQASYNTGIGSRSLSLNTTGYRNTANGFYSLYSNTTGYNNTAIGYTSLRSNTTGSNNTANGHASLYSNTTGSNNTANGYQSLYANTTGSNNTALGRDSGRYIANGTTGRSTGNNGLYLGYNSKASADGTDNEIVIGYNAIGKGSSTATYGNSSMLKHIFEAGNVGIGTTAPQYKLDVAGEANFAIGTSTNQIHGVAAPTQGTDAVNRNYVDSNFIASTSLATITNAFVQGGNSFGSKAILGTNDNQALGIKTNNTERLTILANGNVGIGTNKPVSQLQLEKTVSALTDVGLASNYSLFLRYPLSNNGAGPGIAFGTSGSTDNVGSAIIHERTGGEDKGKLNFYTKITTTLGVAPALVMTLSDNGNVGIGTTTPGYKLDVAGEANFGIGTSTNQIHGVAAPTQGTDAVNRNYVDSNFIASTSLATITKAFVQGGNSFGVKAILGTNDNQALGIKTNGTEKMTILANGNVGVGTTNPTLGRLMINSAQNTNWLYLQNSTESGFYTRIYNGGSGAGSTVPFTRLSMGHSSFGDNASIHFYRGGSSSGGFLAFTTNTDAERMRIDAAGNVGIGTTTPNRRLDLGGGTNGRIYGIDTATNAVFTDSEVVPKKWIVDNFAPAVGGASLWATSSAGIYNVGLGNVGIGTTNPLARLVVKSATSTPNLVLSTSGLLNGDSAALLFHVTTDYYNGTDSHVVAKIQGIRRGSGATGDLAFLTETSGSYVTEKMRILANGNVGIGTNNPVAKLTLQQGDQAYAPLWASSLAEMALGISANTSKISGLDFKNFNSAGQVRLMARNDADNYIVMNAMGTTATASFFGQAGNQLTIFSVGKRFSLGTNDSQPLILGTSNTERMRILSNGNVGIGTTTPNRRLDLGGGTNGRIYGIDTATNAVFTDSEVVPKKWIVDNFAPAVGGASLWATSSAGIYNVGLGNVGIGTTNPGVNLEVAGLTGATLNLNTADSDIQSGDVLGNLVFTARNDSSSDGDENKGKIRVEATGAYTGGPSDLSKMVFSLTNGAGVLSDNITLLSNGNVGIGTTAPSRKLTVYGGLSLGNDSNPTVLEFNTSNYIGYLAGHSGLIFSTNHLNVGLPSGEKMRITSSGNVGIGTTTPEVALDVNGLIKMRSSQITTTSDVINKGYLDSALLAYGSSNNFWKLNGSNLYASSTSWNVGIGTTNPSQKLDVSGIIKSSGNIVQGNTINRSLVSWSASGAATGAVIITLPGTAGTNHGMVQMEINVYEYNSNSATTFICGGHNWSTQWHKYSCTAVGLSNKKVRLGVKDGKYVVVIGEAGATWSYGHVVLSKITNPEFYSGSMDLSGPYTIALNNDSEAYSWISSDLNKFNARTAYFSGNVGVGTNNPGAKLEVASGTAKFLFDPSTSSISSPNTTEIKLQANNQNIFRGLDNWGGTWSDAAVTTYFQTGRSGGNTAFSSYVGTPYNRLAFLTGKFQISNLGGVITPPTNFFQIDYSNTNLFSVQSGGKVGIGTTAPGYKLDVAGEANFGIGTSTNQIHGVAAPTQGTDAVNRNYVDSNFIASTTLATITNAFVKGGNSFGSKATLGSIDNQDFGIITNNTERVTVLKDGNVGIGTTAPESALHIQSDDVIGKNLFLVKGVNPTIRQTVYRNRTDGLAFSMFDLKAERTVSTPMTGQLGRIGVRGDMSYGATAPYSQMIGISINNGGNPWYDTFNFAVSKYGTIINPINASLTTYVSSPHPSFVVNRGNALIGYSEGTIAPALGLAVAGNVGIGTTSPQVTLDVNGLIKMRTSNITTTSDVINKGYLDSALLAYGSSNNFWKLNGSNLYSSSTDWNVGIGTNAPNAKFVVYGGEGSFDAPNFGSVNRGAIHIRSLNSGTRNAITFSPAGTDYAQAGLYVHQDNSAGTRMYLATTNNYTTGPQARLTISNIGNIGIGTTTPSASLDIFGNFKITSGGLVYNTNSSYRFNFSDIFLDHNSLIAQGDINTAGVLETAGTARPNYMLGKLGIGTTNPGSKLSVASDGSDHKIEGIQLTVPESTISSARIGLVTEGASRQQAYIKFMKLNAGIGRSGAIAFFTAGVDGDNNTEQMRITGTGSVGIGTTTPGATYKLDVAGKVKATEFCLGTTCVDDWSNPFSTSTILSIGGLNLNNGNITNVKKLTVGTIDPLYRIDGTNYSSFASAIVGGVKEEYLGRVKISQAKGKEYEYRLDFSKLSAPDELWVWRQTVDFSPENVEVNITPYGAFANTYYIIEDEAIIFRANKPVTVSYRLAGKRLDWQNWPTEAKDQQEKPSFIINNKKLIK